MNRSMPMIMWLVLPRRRQAASPRPRRRRRRRGRLRWRARASWSPSGRLQRTPREHAQGNKVRQMGQYTVGGKLGKLKNWHRFTFPRAKAKQKVFSPEIFCPPNFSKNPILDLLAERKYSCQAKKATPYMDS